MLSSRDHNASFRSARKYAVPYASSPLARDSTSTLPMRGRRKESFSTSNHTHGLGGEAKEAMLRSGLRMKRTGSSLRIVATKGNATLTAAFHHIVHVPDLEVFRRGYTRKESEFAESTPSAMSPFQFVTKDSADFSRWRNKSSENLLQLQQQQEKEEEVEEVEEEEEQGKGQTTQQMDDWLKEMRMKVHIRLVQKQQFTNTANPIEHQPEELQGSDKENGGAGDSKKSSSRPPSRGNDTDQKKKSDKAKGELALDTLEPPPSAKRSPIKKLKDIKKRASLPPLPHKSSPDTDSGSQEDKPRLPKIASHDNNSINAPGTPLFYQRADSIKARRTYSEQDVRRLRTKARNSVGLEPIT